MFISRSFSLSLYSDDIRIVVNFDFPKEMDSYIHRVGRTGRAGKKGFAVSFFVPDKNARLARELVDILNRTSQNVPQELQALTSFSGGRGGGGRGRGGRRY
jgi:superfamily II DNA/RNA helicase